MNEYKYQKHIQSCEEYFEREFIADELRIEEAINDVGAILNALVETVYLKRDFFSDTMTLGEFRQMLLTKIEETI